jgi:hypothetical protein
MNCKRLIQSVKERLLVVAIGLGGLAILAGFAVRLLAQADADFRPHRVVQQMEPITGFPTKTVREAWDELNPSELVLGVTVGDESRAYPINMLTGPNREILNDQLGGQAIAATW